VGSDPNAFDAQTAYNGDTVRLSVQYVISAFTDLMYMQHVRWGPLYSLVTCNVQISTAAGHCVELLHCNTVTCFG